MAPVPWYSPSIPRFLSRSNVNDQADTFGIALPAATITRYTIYCLLITSSFYLFLSLFLYRKIKYNYLFNLIL